MNPGKDTMQPVIDTLVRTLQPLVAELQEVGVGVGEWIEAIKISSFQAARAATDAESGRAIFTRMSVRTGMTRTELQRLRRGFAGGQSAPAPRPVGRQRTARVIDGWQRDPACRNAAGQLLPLALDGPAPSLQSLIKAYAGDVPASSVLSELRRQHLLRALPDGRVLPRADYQRHALARIRQLAGAGRQSDG
jgi:Family of unknown function (DUF6502)